MYLGQRLEFGFVGAVDIVGGAACPARKKDQASAFLSCELAFGAVLEHCGKYSHLYSSL